MTNNKKYKIIALVARNHGFEVLKKILTLEKFEIISIFTHKLNPKIYDPEKNVRNDFKMFKKISEENNIPIFTIDNKNEKIDLEKYIKNHDFDFLISVSWRYLIPCDVFQKSKIGSFNIHRGDLPKFAGVEPIRRALENNEKEIFVCSHIITEGIDQGRILKKESHPILNKNSEHLEVNVNKIKLEIIPIFSKLAIDSLDILLNEYRDK